MAGGFGSKAQELRCMDEGSDFPGPGCRSPASARKVAWPYGCSCSVGLLRRPCRGLEGQVARREVVGSVGTFGMVSVDRFNALSIRYGDGFYLGSCPKLDYPY